MVKGLSLLMLVLVLCASHPAQTAKIKKIIDSNLFETDDGRVIKLAGLDVPNMNHPDRYLRGVADKAYVYARSVFLNRVFDIYPLGAKDSTRNYEIVIMQKSYPLGLLDYNKEYLSQGFGRFTGIVPKTFYNDYRNAEQDALASERGIWKVVRGGSTEVLDRQFSSEEAAGYVQKDSLIFLRNPIKKRDESAGQILSEVVIGPAAGFLTALPSAYMFAGLGALDSKQNKWSPLIWGALGAGVGYITGNALGVYLVAHSENPNVSFIRTVSASFVGAAGGIGLASLFYRSDSAVPYIIALAGPLVGAMVYTHFLVPPPIVRDNYPYSENPGRTGNSSSHKDLYNSTLQYRMNLFTIAF